MSNLINNKSITGFSISGNTIGFVLDNNSVENTSYIKAYVPKFMTDIEMGDGPAEGKYKLNSSRIKNSNIKLNISSNVTTKNYMYLKAYNNIDKEPSITKKGEHITVKFLNDDLTKGRYTAYESEDTENTYNNNRLRFFVDSTSSNNTSQPESKYNTNGDSFIGATSSKTNKSSSTKKKKNSNASNAVTISSSTNKATTIKTNVSSKQNTRKKTNITGDNYQEKDTEGLDTYAKKSADTQYDFLMDSDNGILAMRLNSSSSKEDASEESLMSITMEREGQKIKLKNSKSSIALDGLDLDINIPGGALTLNNDNTSITINGDKAKISNGDSKLELDSDTVLLDNYQSHLYLDGDHVELTNGNSTIDITSDKMDITGNGNININANGNEVLMEDNRLTVRRGAGEVLLNNNDIKIRIGGTYIVLDGDEITFRNAVDTLTLSDISRYMRRIP